MITLTIKINFRKNRILPYLVTQGNLSVLAVMQLLLKLTTSHLNAKLIFKLTILGKDSYLTRKLSILDQMIMITQLRVRL